MGRLRIDYIAGGGLIDRRSFIRTGVALLAASSAAPTLAAPGEGGDRIGDRFPVWMKTPGREDIAYGRPPAPERHIVRSQRPQPPESAGFSMWNTPLANQPGTITPSGLHFGVHHNGIPEIDPGAHELVIHGLVEKPLRYSLENLMRYPMQARTLFIECSGNTAANALSPSARDDSCQDLHGQLSGSEWAGIPLAHLLREAGPKTSAKWVVAEGADAGSHSRSIPLAKLMEDAIVALYQNGERLRASQGYPIRLLLPGWEGNTSVKWLHRLELTDAPAWTKDESGLYTEFLSTGEIARFSFAMDVKSVITHPSGKQTLGEPGFYEISGLAWSGHGKIGQVEVSADEGTTWAPAVLHEPVLDKSLTRFSIPWRWDGKPTTLLSRARDERGNVQPTRERWKARYAAHSFNHYNAVQPWRIGSDGRVENVYL